MRALLIILILSNIQYSQSRKVYEIPFSSKANAIELTVENVTGRTMKNIKVKAVDLPEWINFTENEASIEKLKSNAASTVVFDFLVSKEAPVKEAATVNFEITNDKGDKWEKGITIMSAAPEKYELYQNYPNPFSKGSGGNPTTQIGYQLPFKSFVTLKIYDMLGREVTTLVNRREESGYRKAEWNAAGYSSGMYIYRLTARGENGKTFVANKKLMLIK